MKKTVMLTGVVASAFLLGLLGNNKVYAEEANQNNTEQQKQVIVEVEKGDSLSKIAKKHSSTYQRIFYANTFIENPDIIHPGEKVRVPAHDEELKIRTIPNEKVARKQPVAQNENPTKNYTQKSTQTNINQSDANVWDKLATCESGGNWSINTGNGYYGGLQFTASTWRSVGGSGLPHQHSRAEQIKRGQMLQARSGWGQWPSCTSKLGLR